MRKDREAKRKRNIKIVFGVFIAFIMIFSIFELALYRQDDTTNAYNKFNIQIDSQNNRYVLKINKSTHYFYTWPALIEDIPVARGSIDLIKNGQIIIYSFNPDSPSLPLIEQARYELSQELAKDQVFGVTHNVSAYEAMPVLTCKDAASATPVIFFNVSDNTSITQQGYCVIINANGTEFLRAKDRFLYTYLGVMQESS
jgi:hypothetical protein